jgi:diguanylate cyclase (GGDEF)-like protein/PAS domain S-box-containing protein
MLGVITERNPAVLWTGTIEIGTADASETMVQAEKVRLLYGSSLVLLINLVTGPIAGAMLWPVYPAWMLGTWTGLLVIVVAARVWLLRRFKQRQPAPANADSWARRFAIGATATGCLWGALASVVFMTNDSSYYLFVVFAIGGMVAGAALRNCAFLPAFYGFALCAFLPMVAALLIKGGFPALPMGLLLAAFSLVLMLAGRDNNRWIADSVRAKLKLTRANDELQRLTLNLREEASQRELAAVALEQSNARLQAIGESAQDAIVILDSDGKVAHWNPAAERIFGYTAAEIVGRDYHSTLIPEPLRAKAIAGYKLFVQSGQGEVVGKTQTLNALHKNGSEFPVELSVSALRFGNTWHSLGIVRDVRDRVSAEAQLREREGELKKAQRLARVGSWEWSPQTRVFKWSEEIYHLFRGDPGSLAHTLEDLARVLTPESFARASAAFAALQRTGEPAEIDVEVIPAENRAPGWFSIRGQGERGPNNGLVRIHGTVQDITTRKLAEQRIAQLHAELAQKVEVLRQHEQNMAAIAKLNDILQACHSRNEAYPIVATTASNLFPHANGALAVTATGTHELKTVAQWGADQLMAADLTFDDCWALRSGKTYGVSPSSTGMPCRHFAATPPTAYVCVPLTVYGETTGLLHLSFPSNQSAGEDLMHLIVTFGDVVKLSLANLKLRETLSEQAMRDQLTTLFNRHYLAETLPREIRRAERANAHLSVAMLDIDRFKDFNDTHGHDAGDAVLRDLGKILGERFRAGDIACRYGGEEFLLVLPDCDLACAKPRLQAICSEIRQRTFQFKGEALPRVTVSVGLAELRDDVRSAETLIAAADAALYSAKRNGRDRVEISTGEKPRLAQSVS